MVGSTIECEHADRRRRTTPVRLLFYMFLAIVFSWRYMDVWGGVPTQLAVSVVFPLLFYLFIVSVVEQILVGLSPYRWRLKTDGLHIRALVYLVPVCYGASFLLLVVGSYVVVRVIFDLVGGAPTAHVRADPATWFGLACIVAGISVWIRSPRFSARANIVVSPEGMGIGVGSRHQRFLQWESLPELIGVKRRTIIIRSSDGREMPIRADMIPISYVHVQRIIAFYGKHNEVRSELSLDQGLSRLLDLRDVPVWQQEETLDTGRRILEDRSSDGADDGCKQSASPKFYRIKEMDVSEADRRRLNGPRRALYVSLVCGILSVLSFIGFAVADRVSWVPFLFFLCTALLGARAAIVKFLVFRDNSVSRRWRVKNNRILLSRLWISPTLARLGALGFGMLTLIGWVILVSTLRETEAALPLILAQTVGFGFIAVSFWRNSTRPSRSPAMALDPTGVSFCEPKSEDIKFSWEEFPVVAHVLKSMPFRDAHSVVVFGKQNGGAVIPMDAMAIGYTQLHQLLVFYSCHPEMRAQLNDAQGLAQVRRLMRAPV